jgi:hypothetical protein
MISTFSTASWDECLRSLRVILPTARTLGLDEIHLAAQRAGFSIEWTELTNWENLEDVQILDTVFGSDIVRGNDRGILLPALCFYGQYLPFSVPYQYIKDFVTRFFVQYGESFFNGDTIILLPTRQTFTSFSTTGYTASSR